MAFDRRAFWRVPYIALVLAFLVNCGGGGGGGGPAPPTGPDPPAPPEAQTVFEYSDPNLDWKLAMYLPPGISTYRGAYVVVPGSRGDTRMIVDRRFEGGRFDNHGGDFDGLHFQNYRTHVLALAREHGLAVLGASSSPRSNGVFLAAMTALATESRHPELATAPFLFDGFSLGGCFAYHFTRGHPERVIGFWTQGGQCHHEGDGLAAKQVPGVLALGGADLESRCLNLTKLFENNRPEGALWALTVELGKGHERVLDTDWQFHWMDTVVESRLPVTAAAGASVVLRPMSERIGWLGDRETAEVAQFDDYDKDVSQASWLPSEQVAADWSSFVSPGRPLACPTDGVDL